MAAIAQARSHGGGMVGEIAAHSERDGALLSDADAGVELINVLRPTVAVGRFIVFAALALHRHPHWRERVAQASAGDLQNFVDEVRRFYPFFPVVGGRAHRRFDWQGRDFFPGDWVLLDLYATNHDERIWSEPNRFRPERFEGWSGDRNSLIPQGAGYISDGHRCPGELATVELMKEATLILASRLDYTVPEQDLRVSLRGFPALPRSRFVMSGVRRLPASSPMSR